MSDHNPLQALADYGQSPWLDFIERRLLATGQLRHLIEADGLMGLTSNPAIFQQAIAATDDYQDILAAPPSRNLDAKAVYERIAVRDIQAAADLLRPVYEDRDRRDGYVSLEVSPALAYDTDGTLAEARRLWQAAERPNLMIKVPGTPEGIPAVEQLACEGINVNVTLLFSQAAHALVAEAYLRGLTRRADAGKAIDHVAGVASFFVSRIDTAVDTLLAARAAATSDPAERAELTGLMGRVAIANAKLAYQQYQRLFAGPRWQTLAARGAMPQRLLWASTGTKNPRYADVLYVEELIGPDTVNTLPPATLAAFRDHGRLRPSLTEDIDGARATIETLEAHGISLAEVADALLAAGVRAFAADFDRLLAEIDARRQALVS